MEVSRGIITNRNGIVLILGLAHFWLPVHRFMLLTEVLVTTIILHVSQRYPRLDAPDWSSDQ